MSAISQTHIAVFDPQGTYVIILNSKGLILRPRLLALIVEDLAGHGKPFSGPSFSSWR